MSKEIKPDTNSDLVALRGRVTDFCKKAGYKLSPDADNILHDLVKMKETAGDFYCTCQVGRSAESICVCQPVRNGLVDIMGACYCSLILGGKELKE